MTSTEVGGEKYWFLDINVLFDVFKLTHISFANQIPYPEKINNLVRISLWVGIAASIVMRTYLWLWLPIIIMAITYVIYLLRVDAVNEEIRKVGPDATIKDLPQVVKNRFEQFIDMNRCVKPTVDNPFMNALNFDPRNRKPACQVNSPQKMSEIEQLFNTGLYRSASDIFGKNNSQREFYVMPVTTFPNDQEGFAKWLYGTPPTCKEGNGAQCVANIMDTFNRRMEAPGYGSSTSA
jgi:hypothetical protein